jgi:hypothetical protein
MGMKKKRILMLTGGLTFQMVMDGEKPDVFSLPKPNWYLSELDDRTDQYLKWKACWEGEERCLEVKETALFNLTYWKKVLAIYRSIELESGLELKGDLAYLVDRTVRRIDRWDNINQRIDEQVSGSN